VPRDREKGGGGESQASTEGIEALEIGKFVLEGVKVEKCYYPTKSRLQQKKKKKKKKPSTRMEDSPGGRQDSLALTEYTSEEGTALKLYYSTNIEPRSQIVRENKEKRNLGFKGAGRSGLRKQSQ